MGGSKFYLDHHINDTIQKDSQLNRKFRVRVEYRVLAGPCFLGAGFRHVLLLSRQLISKLSFYKVFLPLILLSHLICFCFLALKNADICHLCVLRRNGRSYDEKKGKTFSFLAKSCNPTTVSGDFSLTG